MKPSVHCPTCQNESKLDSSNPYRPFCSERCRLIDLGEWIEESYTISESEYPEQQNFNNDTSPSKH